MTEPESPECPAPAAEPEADTSSTPGSRVPPRFYNAGPWVRAQFETPEVQAIVSDKKRKRRYLAAAELVEPRFKKEFPGPYPGETDEEFARREEAAHTKERREALVRWEAETVSQHQQRMTRLRKVRIYLRWWRQRAQCAAQNLSDRFRELWNASQKTRALPAAAALPTAKKRRDLSGLDVFQKSSEAPEGQVVTHATGTTSLDIGGLRRACKDLWDAMSEEERAGYEEQARQLNEQRRAEEPVAEGYDEEDPGAGSL